jgi:UDP:flavonoid glycosyltransferase YjiC (YdhE family)
MPLLLARPLPGVPNHLTYTAAEQLFWLFFRRASTRFRAGIGLPPAPLRYVAPNNPVLFGFSPLVIPPPPDWGPQVYVTGWWALDETGWEPPSDLAAFLEVGPPPVFIGFGSMIAQDPAALTRNVIQAVQAAGQRAVLSRGWAGMGDAELPDAIFQADYAPYEWLFPRMAAVIHHGGSGTTGLALRSGVPSLIVPFTADQPFWGWRSAELGVALPPMPASSLTAPHLAQAISRLVAEPDRRAHAQTLASRLRREDGLARAVELVQQLVGE